MTQKPMLRVEEGVRALRNQAGGGGEGSWVQARAAECGGARVCGISFRGNIPSCELLGHMSIWTQSGRSPPSFRYIVGHRRR